MRSQHFILAYSTCVFGAAIQNANPNDAHRLDRRQDLLGGLLGGLVGGLGTVLGGVTTPLLGPVLNPLLGQLAPKAAPAPVQQPGPYPQQGFPPPYGPYGPPRGGPPPGAYNPYAPGGYPGGGYNPRGPPPRGGNGPPRGGPPQGWRGGPDPYDDEDLTRAGPPPRPPPPPPQEQQQPPPQQPQQPPAQPALEGGVTIRGSNIPCRPYPDDLSPDTTGQVILNSPTQVQAVCWAPSTKGTLPRGRQADEGWIQTQGNCFIRVSEVQEYKDYKSTLPACAEQKHWVGTLMEQYSRKDCYSCLSTSTCQSEDLGSPPYADLACFQEGEVVQGNNTWFKNKGAKECYFPAGVFEPSGFLGDMGGHC